jgi:glycosyltransferase involved in cell wall biosynthesis
MQILLANIRLRQRTGTEVVTMELARALQRRGHQVAVFSPDLGEGGRTLRADGIEVTDRLDEIAFAPDIVHGNHNVDLVQGLLRFPATPGVFVCHNPDDWSSEPPALARVRAYVAVCRLSRERIERAVPSWAGRVALVPNAVDLDRFRLRDALPLRPRRALVLTK